jgi:hypothetical protein
MRSTILAVMAVVTLSIDLALSTGAAFGAWDHWIQNGGKKVAKCAGNTSGAYVKLANPDGQWIYVNGIAICKDTGTNYTYDIKYLKVTINNSRLTDFTRDSLNFDWLGMAAYRDDQAQSRIQWLYDQAKPIQGSLPKQGDRSIYFGNLQFVVPKAAIDEATRLTFYLTSQGIVYSFGAL